MDPISRRLVWDHITAIKPGRVILLTTHAMEEADLLSDSVAILCDGELAAFGSPLQLKHEHGSHVQFSIVVGKDLVESVTGHIKIHFADAQEWISLQSSTSGYLTLNIERVKRSSDDEGVEASSLGSFIGWLEQEDCPVKEFTISNSSLEEVFLTVTKGHQHHDQSTMEAKARCCCCCCFCGCRPYKNIPQTDAEDLNSDVHTRVDVNVDDQPKASLSDFSRHLSVRTQTVALFRFYMARNWSGRSSVVNWVVYGFFCAGNMLLGFGLVVFWPDVYFFLLLTGEIIQCTLLNSRSIF